MFYSSTPPRTPMLAHLLRTPMGFPSLNLWPAACPSLPAAPRGLAKSFPTAKTVSCCKILVTLRLSPNSCGNFASRRNCPVRWALLPSAQPRKRPGTHMRRAPMSIYSRYIPKNRKHLFADCSVRLETGGALFFREHGPPRGVQGKRQRLLRDA